MAQQIINVGTAPNDGLGDPLRTAFTKTNNNFNQLFATAGITGIANGTSNVQIPVANGNVTISSAGASNILIVSGTGVYSTGTLNSTGLATLSNLSVTGTTVSTGTIQSLTNVTAVNLDASANVTAAGYLFGDGGFISNITAVSNLSVTLIANGSTSMSIDSSGGNGIVSVGGVANVAVFRTTGEYVTGVLSASGNVTGGNIRTGGLISATSTITSAANITGANILTSGVVSATSNIISTTNVIGGNLLTGGLISAAANITGAYILGNGSQLTGIDATSIQNGTSNVRVVSSGGNVTVGIGGTANVAVFATTGQYITGMLSANGNITGGNILTGGAISATANITGGNILTGGAISATANITGGNITLDTAAGNVYAHDVTANGSLYTSGVISATGNVRGGNINTVGLITATGNITVGNVLTGGLISAAGNITSGNLSVGTGTVTVGNIVNSNGNAVGNIGSSSTYFNRIFAQATTALYADLAEIYSADAEYSSGTVVSFGGDLEVTKSAVEGDNRVAGVISENPSYLMNSGLEAEHRAAVALTGRVPTLVIGPVRKGDMMVSAGNGWARASATPAMGTVIGKALVNFDGDSGIIEIVVGRL